MNVFDQNHEFYNQPIRLSEEQRQNPEQVINDFLGHFHLIDCRVYLAAWLECALVSENAHFAEAKHRNAIAMFAEKLEELLEANYLIHK